LDMPYRQVAKDQKQLLALTITYSEFDRDHENTNYTFSVDMYAHNYSDLLQNFNQSADYFCILFVIIGVALVGLGALIWVLHRMASLSMYGLNPPFKLLTYLSLLMPPMFTGVALATLPLMVSLYAVEYLFKGFVFTDPLNADAWLADVVPMSYSYVRASPKDWSATRNGRIGTAFLVLGLIYMYAGSRLLIPLNVSKRETKAQENKREAARDVWTPTAWRRLHFIYITVGYALFLTFLIDISFFEQFGDNQYVFVASFKLMNLFIEEFLGNALNDMTLVVPLSLNMGVIQGLVTFGSQNFMQFIISFLIDVAFTFGETMYLGPRWAQLMMRIELLKKSIASWWTRKFGSKRKMSLEDELRAEEIAAAAAKQAILDAELKALKAQAEQVSLPIAAQAAIARAKRGLVKKEPAAGSVDQIVDLLAGYCCDAQSFLQQVFLCWLLLDYRHEIQIPLTYGIRVSDTRLYLYFAVIILPFQFVFDMLMLSSYESLYNLKVFEYLVFARYRFIKRTRRWLGMDKHLDECIDESLRRTDQMCFSSQYHFMTYFYSQGMFMLIMGVVTLAVAGTAGQYNFLQDPLLIPLCLVLVFFNLLLGVVLYRLAGLVKLWVVRTEASIWHSAMGEGLDALYAIPGAKLLKKEALTAAETAVMNQRISSETFRHKFLDFNRTWLVDRLPQLLTPRILRRSRPFLIEQLEIILKASKANLHEEEAVVKALDTVFDVPQVGASEKAVMRWWLGMAKRNIRYRDAVAPLVERERKAACESCGGTAGGLVVEQMVPMDALVELYETEVSGESEFEEGKWKAYFLRNQRFRTVCGGCVTARGVKARSGLGEGGGGISAALSEKVRVAVTTRTDSSMGVVDAGAVFREIAREWVARARKRLRAYHAVGEGAMRLGFDVLEFGDDTEEKEELRARGAKGMDGGVPVAARPVILSAASIALAHRWLADAREQLYAPGEKKPMEREPEGLDD